MICLTDHEIVIPTLQSAQSERLTIGNNAAALRLPHAMPNKGDAHNTDLISSGSVNLSRISGQISYQKQRIT